MLQSRGGYRKRDDTTARRFGGDGAAPRGFGKLDQAVTKGVLSGGETASVWKGPAHSPDEDTGGEIAIHYATHDMDADGYIEWAKINGKVYVSPWECPE